MTGRDGLSAAELRRYARHVILPEVGEAGQLRLKAGRVLLVGAGGLGSPAALYLAAAGVGTLGIVDDDIVDESNLQRQILHGTSTVGLGKLVSAEARVHDLNPHVVVEPFPTRLTAANAREIISAFDVVVDGSDNFPTRYLVNDACVLEGKPDVYGAILKFEGQVSVFGAKGGPCYRCLFRDPPPPELVPSCEEAGVIGVIPGIIGTLQALEVVKLLTGIGTPLAGRLLILDGLSTRFRELTLQRDPQCPVCGTHPTVTELIDYEAFCGETAGATTERDGYEITPGELATRLVDGARPVLIDVREAWEWQIGSIDGSLHIPLGELPAHVEGLDKTQPVVAYCHHGARSLAAARILWGAGFTDVRSLRGGIDAWAREVDEEVGTY